MKARVLQISKYYFPYIGGIENTCKQLVDCLSEYESAVVCFNENKNDIVEEIDGAKVYRVGTKINISRQALSFSYFPVLKKALKEFDPNIIHFHWANPYPVFVLLSMIPKKAKLVVHYHMDIINQKKIYPFVKPIEKALLKRADLILVTSPNYKTGSLPLQPFANKIKVLPSAMDEGKFSLRSSDEENIAKVKARYGGRKIVFFVGRHIQYKGLPYLIEAEKYVKCECEIVVAGSGPLTEELKSACHSKRVHFVGRLSDDELRWHHYAASVFAFPSITKNEAFGVALAEAMYCKTPAVTFTIPGSGVNWVNLNGVTGIEVPNGDAKAFAQAIDRLLADDVLAAQYAAAGRQRVIDNFTIEPMINKLRSYYDSLI